MNAENNLVNICIVDDHPVFRKGLMSLLEQEERFRVIGECSDTYEAMKIIEKALPDVMVLDISLKGMNGIEFTQFLKQNYPSVAVLILTMHDEIMYADRAMRAGAKGYVLKQEAGKLVRDAILQIHCGKLYLNESMKDQMLNQFLNPTQSDSREDCIKRLSNKEFEIFLRIGEGMGNSGISGQLNISTKTIETYKRNIMQKLQIESASELRKYAVRWHQLNLPR